MIPRIQDSTHLYFQTPWTAEHSQTVHATSSEETANPCADWHSPGRKCDCEQRGLWVIGAVLFPLLECETAANPHAKSYCLQFAILADYDNGVNILQVGIQRPMKVYHNCGWSFDFHTQTRSMGLPTEKWPYNCDDLKFQLLFFLTISPGTKKNLPDWYPGHIIHTFWMFLQPVWAWGTELRLW